MREAIDSDDVEGTRRSRVPAMTKVGAEMRWSRSSVSIPAAATTWRDSPSVEMNLAYLRATAPNHHRATGFLNDRPVMAGITCAMSTGRTPS